MPSTYKNTKKCSAISRVFCFQINSAYPCIMSCGPLPILENKLSKRALPKALTSVEAKLFYKGVGDYSSWSQGPGEPRSKDYYLNTRMHGRPARRLFL